MRNKNSRYFIIWYSATRNKKRVSGQLTMSTKGKYISQEETTETLNDKGMDNIFITNIIELTKSDFEDWISEKTED